MLPSLLEAGELFSSYNIVARFQHEVSELTAHACIGRASEIPRVYTVPDFHESVEQQLE